MSKNYTHVLDKIINSPWIIEHNSLVGILDIVERHLSGDNNAQYTFDIGDRSLEREQSDKPHSGVGVLPIIGPIFPRANMMTQMSGATSIEQLQSQFNAMLEDDSIKSIVLDIDSPGGMADMIQEMGDTIFNARGKKPVVAVANTTAASAAYWLGSQAEKLYVTPSGQVGSIGVYTVHQDKSAQQEKLGINTTLISAGEYKVEGSPYGPLSDDAKEFKQNQVNDTYNEFLGAVARGRGMEASTVQETYGTGRVYDAKAAQSMNMVDGVQTFQSVVGGLMDYSTTGGNGFIGASGYTYGTSDNTFVIYPTTQGGEESMDELTPETLAALGLGEEATSEEIEAAVLQLANSVPESVELTSKEIEFAEQFPEQAKQLAELRERDVVNSAKLFSDEYAKFSADSAHGFSSVALEAIENAHKQISGGSFTHDDLKSFLDLFNDKAAIVDYTEHGTSREAEMVLAESAKDAGNQLATLARQAQAEAGGIGKLSWGDALAKVSTENPELARQYNGSLGGGE